MTNFRALENITIHLNISQIRILIQIKLCRNTNIRMDLSKNNHFSTQEVINYISGTEKRKKVLVCEMFESSGPLLSSMLPILSWKLKKIAYRGRFTILTPSKLELFSQYLMTSWHYIVTKSFIIDDVGVWDSPLVCLFFVKSITNKIEI